MVHNTAGKMFRVPVVSIVLVVVCVISCGRTHYNPKVTRENFNKITEGMPRQAVMNILGEPDSRLISRPCKCADIETLSYLSVKIGIDVRIFNGRVCSANFVDFSKYEIHE
jgi:hypothetical protein